MSDFDSFAIVLVDDDEGHADLVKINLERSGVVYAIEYFSNGHRALEYLRIHATEGESFLIILDINMPGLDGHQVLAQLKANEYTRDMPVIMLSTAGNEKEIERCTALGCDMFITKPVAYDKFIEAVEQLGAMINHGDMPHAKKKIA